MSGTTAGDDAPTPAVDTADDLRHPTGDKYDVWVRHLPRPACTYGRSTLWRRLKWTAVRLPPGEFRHQIAVYLTRLLLSQVPGSVVIEVMRLWNGANTEPLTEQELWTLVREVHFEERRQGRVARYP